MGSKKLEGVINGVTPLSKNGVISFIVKLNDDSNSSLRSGLKTDVYVMNAVKEGITRVANGSYYTGRGSYQLFVLDGENKIVKRKVELGDSNFEYVEVVSGLKPGDNVVVSDLFCIVFVATVGKHNSLLFIIEGVIFIIIIFLIFFTEKQ